MNEHLNAEEQAHMSETARHVGLDAVGQTLFDETADVVQIAVYVNGRMIHTKTNSATVARVMALLTGMAD
jgi:hypothetical protein